MANISPQDTDEGIVGINVTPLVDITLVLLIIFMVVAKMVVSQSVPSTCEGLPAPTYRPSFPSSLRER